MKKQKSILAELEERFVDGCREKVTLDEGTAKILWEQMSKYGEYCFNKSHAVSYAMITYWTAWLKVYYPTEFMAATLTTEFRGTGKDREQKVLDTIQECKRMNIKILQPNINESEERFTVPGPNKIRFALAGIKGVGPAAIRTIVENKPYANLEDFLSKIEKRECNKKVVISLILSGAFDFENPDRIQNLNYYFDLRGEETDKEIYVNRTTKLKTPQVYTLRCKLEWEKVFLGGYISAHPLDELTLPSWKEQPPGTRTSVAGIVYSVRKTKVRRGSTAGRDMGFAFIDTPEGDMKVVLFPKVWDENIKKISNGNVIRVNGKLQEDSEIIADTVTNPRIKALDEPITEFEEEMF